MDGQPGDFACFVLEDLVSFSTSEECGDDVTVSLVECTERVGSLDSSRGGFTFPLGSNTNNNADMMFQKGDSVEDLPVDELSVHRHRRRHRQPFDSLNTRALLSDGSNDQSWQDSDRDLQRRKRSGKKKSKARQGKKENERKRGREGKKDGKKDGKKEGKKERKKSSKKRRKSTSPTPMPTTLLPTSSPTALGDQTRGLEFDQNDCSVPCVDFSEVVCLRSSTFQNNVESSVTTLSYRVSDNQGKNSVFEMDFLITSQRIQPSCLVPLSTCSEER